MGEAEASSVLGLPCRQLSHLCLSHDVMLLVLEQVYKGKTYFMKQDCELKWNIWTGETVRVPWRCLVSHWTVKCVFAFPPVSFWMVWQLRKQQIWFPFTATPLRHALAMQKCLEMSVVVISVHLKVFPTAGWVKRPEDKWDWSLDCLIVHLYSWHEMAQSGVPHTAATEPFQTKGIVNVGCRDPQDWSPYSLILLGTWHGSVLVKRTSTGVSEHPLTLFLSCFWGSLWAL